MLSAASFFLLMYTIKYKEIDQSNLPCKQPVCANWTSNPILFVIRPTGSFRSECVVLFIRILAGATLIIIAPVDLSAGKSGEKLAVPFMLLYQSRGKLADGYLWWSGSLSFSFQLFI
jgi:hypothetical protein